MTKHRAPAAELGEQTYVFLKWTEQTKHGLTQDDDDDGFQHLLGNSAVAVGCTGWGCFAGLRVYPGHFTSSTKLTQGRMDP
jgi:hypothetical protein